MSTKSFSRRDFLKLGCLTTGAAGLAICGVGAAISDPDKTPIEQPSFHFGAKNMQNRILVAYASATGSTIEIAASIGETLGAHTASVDVKSIQDNPQVETYHAVMIGSAIQHGNWLPQAVDFIKTNQQALSQVPVALFCVHITNLGDDENSLRNRMAFMNEVRPLVRAIDEGYFAGRFNRRGASLLLPELVARFVPTLDFRNWKKIHAWADTLCPRLFPSAG
jgi:menaquinone-dependent protoporphyrinogen oxidase